MTLSGYMSSVEGFKTRNIEVGPVALDILQQFAATGHLSAYDVCSNLKKTKLEMAYKNVHKRIQRLVRLHLIEERIVEKTGEHGAKYYALTDDGIYQLFLKRVGGLIFDLLSLKKHRKLTTISRKFIKHYGDNTLFEKFLYPYFEKNTISSFNEDMLSRLFLYLHDCCKEIESTLNYAKIDMSSIPIVIEKFKWDHVRGPEKKELLTSIDEIFGFRDKDGARVEQNPDNRNVVEIISSQDYASIKLDLKAKKAIATYGKGKSKKNYEFVILESGPDYNICTTKIGDNSMKVDDRKLGNMLIYRLLFDMGMRDSEESNNADILKALSDDFKFMRYVGHLHRQFDDIYHKLIGLRT